MKAAIHFTLVFSLCSYFSFDMLAQAGWDQNTLANKVEYTPEKIATGKKFSLTFYPPAKLEKASLKNWFTSQVSTLQKDLGSPSKEWFIKQNKEGLFYTNNTFVGPSGEKMSVAYQLEALAESNYFIGQTVTSTDIGLMIRHGKDYNKVLAQARQVVSNIEGNPSTPSDHQEHLPLVKKTTTNDPVASKAPADLGASRPKKGAMKSLGG